MMRRWQKTLASLRCASIVALQAGKWSPRCRPTAASSTKISSWLRNHSRARLSLMAPGNASRHLTSTRCLFLCSFASAERVSPRRLVDFRNLPDDGGPIANFRFLYRSRGMSLVGHVGSLLRCRHLTDALKREMIIPRSPTPPPPAFAALSAEDLRRLAMERFEQLRVSRSFIRLLNILILAEWQCQGRK